MMPIQELKAAALAATPSDIEQEKVAFREQMQKIDWIIAGFWSDETFIEHYHREFQVWLAAKRASMGSAEPIFAGRVFVDQLTGMRSAVLNKDAQALPDMTRLYAAPASTDTKDETDWEAIAKAALVDLKATQKALSFWLPMVPPSEGCVAERVANDAWLLCGLESDEDSAEKLGWIQLSADINLDAQRWQAIRNVSDDQLGSPGIPCLAIPEGEISGDYVSGEDADIAADEYLRGLASQPDITEGGKS